MPAPIVRPGGRGSNRVVWELGAFSNLTGNKLGMRLFRELLSIFGSFAQRFCDGGLFRRYLFAFSLLCLH